MSYVGGKSRVAADLGQLLARECGRLGVREVWEPFCGGLYVTAQLGRLGVKVHASDLSRPLITLYRALRLGWSAPEPPLTLSQWRALKDAHQRGEDHPLIGYAGFCASFNSVFFASPALEGAAGQLRVAKLRVRVCQFKELWCTAYHQTMPPPGSVIYCDPPYAGTDGSAYRSLAKEQRAFDSEAFWAWCRARHAEGSTVVVSEYSAPEDVQRLRVFDLAVTTAHHTGEVKRVLDSVYCLRSCRNAARAGERE